MIEITVDQSSAYSELPGLAGEHAPRVGPARRRIAALSIFALLTLTACQSTGAAPDPDLAIDKATHPEQRYFEGQIISLRPTTNTMLISRGGTAENMNIVTCVYNPQTKIFVDGKPAGLADLSSGMPVKVRAHMQNLDMPDEQCVVDVAKFTSPAAATQTH